MIQSQLGEVLIRRCPSNTKVLLVFIFPSTKYSATFSSSILDLVPETYLFESYPDPLLNVSQSWFCSLPQILTRMLLQSLTPVAVPLTSVLISLLDHCNNRCQYILICLNLSIYATSSIYQYIYIYIYNLITLAYI